MDKQFAWRPRSQAIELGTLHKELARHPLVVVHFWAVWDLHDRRMDEMLQELMPRYAGRAELRSFDVDMPEGNDFCRDCCIKNVPAIAVIVRGVWLETLVGLRPRDELESRLGEWIIASAHSSPDGPYIPGTGTPFIRR
jgi:thioredoxin-like negative regulator of GroEL